MKNQEFVHSEYPKCCRYCEKGEFSFDGTMVLCPKYGIMEPEDFCGKFVYDPLKRVPMDSIARSADFAPEDFVL